MNLSTTVVTVASSSFRPCVPINEKDKRIMVVDGDNFFEFAIRFWDAEITPSKKIMILFNLMPDSYCHVRSIFILRDP